MAKRKKFKTEFIKKNIYAKITMKNHLKLKEKKKLIKTASNT